LWKSYELIDLHPFMLAYSPHEQEINNIPIQSELVAKLRPLNHRKATDNLHCC
jgi:hypothetical protein